MLANTFMRAPGEAVGTFGLECAVDELAAKLGMDPIELRIRNEPDKDPTHGHALLVAQHRRGLADGCRTVRLGQRNAEPGRGATASGWSAWAAPPRPIPITACPAAPRASR